jgi:hypothetical protein
MREQFFYQHKKCLVQAQYFANVFFLLTFYGGLVLCL